MSFSNDIRDMLDEANRLIEGAERPYTGLTPLMRVKGRLSGYLRLTGQLKQYNKKGIK